MRLVTFVVSTLIAQTIPAGFPALGKPAPPYQFERILNAGVAAPASVAALTPDALKGKVVVLDFFATWCAPCVASLPRTDTLIQETRDLPVIFLAVANEPADVLETFLKTHRMNATMVLDRIGGNGTFERYFIRSLPFVVIVAPDGTIARFTEPSALSRAMVAAAAGRQRLP